MADILRTGTLIGQPGAVSARVADEADLGRLLDALQAAFGRADLTREQSQRLAGLAEDAARLIRRRRDADEMRRVQAELDAQAAVARRLADAFRRRGDTFEGALATARAGIWECRLRDEKLTWTGGVYDLFDVRPGAALHRNDTIGCYTPASLKALDEARGRAIATGSDFRLDAEIVTTKGNRRWIRLSGAVERVGARPVRLYGMKQDVTEEKVAAEQVRRLAEIDPLTGLANRRQFEVALADAAETPEAALALVDLDRFKQINDTFGHAMGDACLKEAASRLRRVCRGATLVARIGGDEFAALFGSGLGPDGVERLGRDLVEALRIPVARGDFRLEFGASAGIARAEWSAPSDWFARADAALYAAKAAGGGAIRSFSPALPPIDGALAPRAALPELRQAG